MGDSKIVRAKLRKLLRSVDMESATQRSIQKQLEDELGIPLGEYKQLITDEIDAFLLEEGDGDSDYEPEADAAAEPPAKKKKTSTGAAAAGGGGEPAGTLLRLSDKRFVVLSDFRGKWYVNIREYYEKEGELAPSSKGLSLGADQWRKLASMMPKLGAALEERDESQSVDLGGLKRAGPSNFGGRASLDLREFYEPASGGEPKPGKKGIALTPDQFALLRESAGMISDKLLEKLGGSWPAAPAAGAAGAEPGDAGGSAAGPSARQSAGAGGSGGGGASGGGGGFVELSTMRRADVSEFKGKHYCNIREHYSREGEMLPGKKGISLPLDQFSKLAQNARALGDALRAKNTDYYVVLSAKRRAAVSLFKGTYYVNIREYYEKDGQQLPGQKGISLPPDQWAKLEPEIPRLLQRLEAATK